MDLRGWNYVGRVLNEASHERMVDIAIHIRENASEYNQVWNPDLQTKIGTSIGIRSPGQVRTFKRLMEQFGLLRKGALNSKTNTVYNNIMSDEGKVIINLTEINNLIKSNDPEKNVNFTNLVDETIKLLYLKSLLKTTISNENGEQFRPAFLFVKACREFAQLDFYEWYFLNNFVSSENAQEEWSNFVDTVRKYRYGEINQSEINIIKNELSHSYILKTFENVGLIVTFEDSENIKHYKLNDRLNEIIDTLV